MEYPDIIQTLLLCLVVLFTALRLYTRLLLMRAPGIDDLLTMIAFLIYIARAVILYTNPGNFSQAAEVEKVVRANWIMVLLYIVGTLVIKLSFSVTLYLIIQTRRLAVTIIVVATWTTVVTCYEFFWTLFACYQGICESSKSWAISMSVHTMTILIADVVLGIVIPVLLLRGLHMSMALRLSVGVTIGVGSLASIATIARLVYTILVLNNLNLTQYLILWMHIEFNINMICTAAATLKPLLRKMGILAQPLSSVAGQLSTPHIKLKRDSRIQHSDEVAIWAQTDREGIAFAN